MLLDLFIFILPAYIANMVPVVCGGGAPLDLRKEFMGKRILGDHKTIRGTLSALVAGPVVALVLMYSPMGPLSSQLSFRVGALMSLGIVFGDLFGSFIKRRMDIQPGSSLPLVDQLDFIVFALLFAGLEVGLQWQHWAILLVVTPVLHLLANRVAYELRFKDVPY